MIEPSKMIDALLNECEGNQTEVARRLGTSQSQVYRIWQNGQQPKWDLYNSIKREFDKISTQDSAA